MSIYTGYGDQGDTSGPAGAKVRKTHPMVAAVGALDELSAHLGWALSAGGELAGELETAVGDVQGRLLSLGAAIANPDRTDLWADGEAARALEARIDAAGAALPALHQFILARGSELACRLHVTRTVCRRAERALVEAADAGQAPPAGALVYVNRLSDLLFVLARRANQAAGVGDIGWTRSPG